MELERYQRDSWDVIFSDDENCLPKKLPSRLDVKNNRVVVIRDSWNDKEHWTDREFWGYLYRFIDSRIGMSFNKARTDFVAGCRRKFKKELIVSNRTPAQNFDHMFNDPWYPLYITDKNNCIRKVNRRWKRYNPVFTIYADDLRYVVRKECLSNPAIKKALFVCLGYKACNDFMEKDILTYSEFAKLSSNISERFNHMMCEFARKDHKYHDAVCNKINLIHYGGYSYFNFRELFKEEKIVLCEMKKKSTQYAKYRDDQKKLTNKIHRERLKTKRVEDAELLNWMNYAKKQRKKELKNNKSENIGI